MEELLKIAYEYGRKYEISGGHENYFFEEFLADNAEALQLQQTGVIARCNMDLVGKELNYISPITKAKQPFKVSHVFVNIFIQGLKERQVYAEVFAVSEKGNKYKIDEFSEVQVKQ